MKKYFVIFLLCVLVSGLVLTGCDSGGGNSDDATYTVKLVGYNGDVKTETVSAGASYTVPGLPLQFMVPSLKEFDKWNDGSADIAEGATLTVNSNITLTAQWKILPGMLDGLFSVASGKQVRFSKGNMYWDGSAFKFEEEQYTTGPSSWDSSHVSLFTFSKEASSAYAEDFDGETEADDTFFINGSEGEWRVLTGGSSGEWKYLFETRSTTTNNMSAGSRYAVVSVNGENGVLLFPDVFTWTAEMGIAPTTVNAGCADYGAGTYTLSQFAAIEAAGAVFLPTAGFRINASIYSLSDQGSYWSSTVKDDSQACNLSFNESAADPFASGEAGNRNNGFAVRVVIDAAP